MADPGFSPGGGANSQNCYYFSDLCRKLHENERIWTPRGGARPWRPPLDPPMLYAIRWIVQYHPQSKVMVCWRTERSHSQLVDIFPFHTNCTNQKSIFVMITSNIGGSKGGRQGRAPPRGSKFFHFHAVFGKDLKNNSNFRSWRPPRGKSWIRH